MASVVMPGTVIRFGAEYRRRPVLSLFGPRESRGDGTLSVPDTQIRLQASIEITRQYLDFRGEENEIILHADISPENEDDPRGRLVDMVV